MSSKVVLITGITGFSGSHLAEYMLDKGYKVCGLTRGRYQQFNFIENIKDNIDLKLGDLSDINSIRELLIETNPDIIYHLGAQTSVPMSWRAPKLTIDSNTLGTLNLLESIRKLDINPRTIIVGTSEEYGMVYQDETPIKEEQPFRPLSPYGVSKVATDLLGYQYHQSYGLDIVRVRPFNIIGSRGGTEIFTANFAIQLNKIEKSLQESIIKVGNLNSIRDLVDVRDLCRAYEMCINKCETGDVYNICTENGHTINYILDLMIKLSNIENVECVVEPNRLRPSDVVNLIGCNKKFVKTTGWKPTYTLEQSLEEVLNYWSYMI